ncbi:MAG: M23 family metallopeptidase [Candidatus Curtissbacteria bacterium]|nr:M23 family metallopeptidase [Candidatus Curtissbacteria bacterium]
MKNIQILQPAISELKVQAQAQAEKALKRARQIEAKQIALNGLKFTKFQLSIRPRLRLLAKVLPVLTIAFIATSQIASFVEPKTAEVKINGQPILVAEHVEGDANVVEIAQSVGAKLSPFEFRMPVGGNISQGFSGYHRAFDITSPLGTPIKPVGAGTVEFAGFVSDGKGNLVVIDHGDGLKTAYAHMGKIYVKPGSTVNTQTDLGTIGLTGRTTGAHVHFELYDNGVAVNPGNLLPSAEGNLK